MYERASSIQARILCLMWQPPHVISLSDYVLTRRLCHSLQHNLARSVTSLSLMKSAHSHAKPDCSFGNLDVTVKFPIGTSNKFLNLQKSRILMFPVNNDLAIRGKYISVFMGDVVGLAWANVLAAFCL